MNSSLGRFEIQAEIGRGGFGQVFRAYDPVMNRTVAVKVLTATEDASSFARFKNEATAAGNLHHENIVTVYEFGQEEKTPFLVMEYLSGEDLQHIIKNDTPLSLYQKIRIMDQVADGLHCAHRNGVLHRDVKPANIMVLKDGVVKIMDFGIARLTRDTSTRLTQQGYLIGTVVYMAPELFSSSLEVDALCDIWSYGVILYELLTGKNPFQTGNMHSEMYRILNQDPDPLPSDEYPPELHAVIARLLCRQREFRYQTLEDTRFDLQPILKNLEKAEADRLLSHAQQLIFQQQWAEALSTARDARRMDPQNGTARIIFERAQTELQRQSLRPRIEDLVRRSNDVADQRKISEAIELLDAARKLDTANEKVAGRLQELRLIKARMDEAAKLVAESAREFRDKRLTPAFEHASEAVALDPDNPEARRLLDGIQAEIQSRDADRAMEAEIRRARGLMAIDDLDGAQRTLQAADAKYPGRADTQDLLARLTTLIADRERRRDFARRLELAKNAVRDARFEEAVNLLQETLEAFPNEVEATDLLAYASQELKARQRSDDIKRIIDSATESSRAQRFAEATRILEEGLKKYPDDLPLTRILRSTHADSQAFERERALQAGIKRCEALREAGQWQPALDAVARLLAEYPNTRELRELETLIRKEKSRAERAAAIHNAVTEAEGLLHSGRPDNAGAVVEAAILSVGADAELTALMEKVKDAQRIARERSYIESELKHAKGFEQSGDITTSLKIIDEALLRSPQSPDLLKARERLGNDRERAQREREVSREAAAVEAALDRKEWPQARLKLEEATKLFPSENVFSQLDAELRRRKNEHIAQLVSEGRALLDAGQVTEAEEFLSANLLDSREQPDVMALGRDIVAEKRRREKLQAEEAQKRIDEQRAAAKRTQLLDSIRHALDRSNWSQAIQLIDQVRQDYPNDPALIPLQATALDQRRDFLESAAAAVRAKLAENKLDDAQTLFDQNLARHHDQSLVRTVSEEIAAAQSLQATEEQKRAFIVDSLKQAALPERQNDFPRALAILQKARQRYPDDSELTAAQNRVQSAIERAERERSLGARVAVIKRDIDRSNWQDAFSHLNEARDAFPDSPPELHPLQQQAVNLRDREIQAHVDKANSLLKLGNLADAEKLLNKQLAPFAGEPLVAALAIALKEEKLRESLIQSARSHTAARRFDDADNTINQLAAQRPEDPEVPRLRTALEAAREQDRKEKLYRAGRAEGDQLLRAREYTDAIARFEYLLTQFPGDRQLQQDLAGAVAAEERSQKAARKLADTQAAEVQPHDVPPRPKGMLYGIAALAVAAIAGLAYWLWPAHIELSTASLHFDYQQGTPVPPLRKITVTGSSNIATPQTSAAWVAISRGNAVSGSTEFLVQVQPATLSPGKYAADLAFPSDKKVHVDLVVLPPTDVPKPQFDVDPASLTFPYSTAAIAPLKITVTSSSPIPDPTVSERWVTVSRTNSGDGKAEFTVRVSAKGLAVGHNTADLTFTSEKKVQVELTVPAGQGPVPATLEVRPESLVFPAGGARQIITVTGASPLPDPKLSDGWLSFTRRNIGAGKAEFAVQTSPAGLEPGRKYTTDLVFSPQKRVHVELTTPTATIIKVPPVITLDVQPTELHFRYKHTAAPPAQVIVASGPTDIADPKKTAPWITITRRSTAANKTEFSIQASADKLDPGAYTDDLIFSPQKKVHVDLLVYDTASRFIRLQGSTTWSGGTLNSGDELDIKGTRVLKGSGRIDPELPTGEILVDPAKLPTGFTVLENPTQDNNFTLRLRNVTAGPQYSFTIPWTRKN